MTLRSNKWRGRLPAIALLGVLGSVHPLSAAGADGRSASKPGVIKASLDKVGATTVASTTPRMPAKARAQQSGGGQSGSFFRTKPGLIALAVMAAGTGFALYSAKNDRITSPGKN